MNTGLIEMFWLKNMDSKGYAMDSLVIRAQILRFTKKFTKALIFLLKIFIATDLLQRFF